MNRATSIGSFVVRGCYVMRIPNIVVVLIVGVAGAVIGYRLATPGNSEPIAESRTGHEGHGHGSPSVEATSSDAVAADWCAEHWVPESECTICHPALVEEFKARSNWCGEHNLPESHCRQCNPRLTFSQEPKPELRSAATEASYVSVFFPANESGCTNDKALIQFKSAETASRSGIAVTPIIEASATNAIESPAEIKFDDTKVRALTTTVAASVVRWLVNPGQHVAIGQALAELESPEMVAWLAELLNARADWQVDSLKLERAGGLHRSNLISQAEWEETQAAALSAQSRLAGVIGKLQSAGMSRTDIEETTQTKQVSARFTVKATENCTVIERRAPLGELLPAGATLALLGDSRSLWIEAHVRQQDIGRFRLGDRVQFSSDGQSLARAEGIVTWIADYLEPVTKAGLVRARVEKSSSDLSANLFGRMSKAPTSSRSSLLIPKDAVQWEGCCNIVFVQEAEARFRPHKVTIGSGDNNHYAVLTGLSAGDKVVTSGSFFLKTELLKDKLGVGCTGE